LGDVDAAYKAKLINRLPAERRERLTFLPVTPPSALPSEIARHDIGLALELDFPASKNYTISNKILQYLNAGVAVLASDTIGQIEVLTRAPGVGIIATLSQTTELTAKLDVLLADRQRLAAMGEAARKAAEDIYCWEREAPRLVAAAESALRRPVSQTR
jgi:glycosyltransferase involved in cell wall biosynthesis